MVQRPDAAKMQRSGGSVLSGITGGLETAGSEVIYVLVMFTSRRDGYVKDNIAHQGAAEKSGFTTRQRGNEISG
jgi:hypothetical protein